MVVQAKTCFKCKQLKPASEFGVKAKTLTGLDTYCKPCARVISRKYKSARRQKRPVYDVWIAMKARCYHSSHPSYRNYGARGITVCPRWLDSYEAFESDMGIRPTGTTLERIDNDGMYEPENCRWATQREQAYNRRSNLYITYEGQTLTLYQWADKLGMKRNTLKSRMDRLGFERAVTEPYLTRNRTRQI